MVTMGSARIKVLHYCEEDEINVPPTLSVFRDKKHYCYYSLKGALGACMEPEVTTTEIPRGLPSGD